MSTFVDLSLMSIHPTKEIILRQFAVKSKSTNSLVKVFKEKLYLYGLQSIHDLYKDLPEKEKWKKEVKKKVISEASTHIGEEAQQMSTLQYLHHHFIYNEPHPVVQFVDNTRQVTRACIKAMVLVGAYPLQLNRFKMKKADSSKCLMCNAEVEDTEHFIDDCPDLENVRIKYQAALNATLPESLQISKTQAILDSRRLMVIHPEMKKSIRKIEEISRDLIYALHIRRSVNLNISSHINYIQNPLPKNPLLS